MSPNYTLVSEIADQNLNTIWGMPDWACWILIALLLLISALFSASENTFSNLNRYHFKVLADKGKLLPKLILKMANKFDNTLVTILVGNNIVQTIMSFLSAVLFMHICQQYGLGSGVEAILSTVVMSFLVYVVSDTVPKILSKNIPNKMAYILVIPDYIVGIILLPISIIFRGILYLVHKIFKIKDDNILTKEDFIEIADEAIIISENDKDNEEIEELFEEDELKLIDKAFIFDEISVNQVLTKKENIFSINIENLNIESLNKIILDTKYSRIPVYKESKDNIIGILTVREYFKEYMLDNHLDIRSTLNQPIYVYEDEKVDDIFKRFNKEKQHIALVKDKNENLIGMITMEDILEELVGKISEEKKNPLKKECY